MSDDMTFQEYIAAARQNVTARLQILHAEKAARTAEIDEAIAEMQRELSAIDAYESAKLGKRIRDVGRRRYQRGARREAVINALTEHGALGRGQLLSIIGVKGDKAGEMSISNALAALMKNGEIMRDGHVYYRASEAPQLHSVA